MEDPHKKPSGFAKNRRFFSLKWKALFLLSLVLILINTSFPFLSYMNFLSQFDDRRETVHKRFAQEFEGILKQTAQDLQLFGAIIPSLKGMEEALLLGKGEELISAFEHHWPLIQLDTGIDAAYFYSASGRELAGWRANGFTQERDPLIIQWAEAMKTKEQPVTALSCHKLCAQYAMVPILLNGKNMGAILLQRSLADVIVNFQGISGVDIGVIVHKTRGDNRLPDTSDATALWNTEVVALTHRSQTFPLLKKLVLQTSSIDEALKGRKLRDGGIDYEIRLIPLKGLVNPDSGHLVIIDDISDTLSEIRGATQQSVFAGLLGLLLSGGFLLAILSKPMTRLEEIANTLPLLAKGAFKEARSAANKGRKGWFNDEIDVLDNTAISLSYQLEKLEKQVKKRTQALADQMEELKHEKAFISNLLDTARIIILTQSETGKIMMLNQHGSDLSGYSLQALSRTIFLDLLSTDKQSPILKGNLLAIGNSKQAHFSHESVMSCKDGSTLHIAWFHSALEKKNAHEPAILSIGLDITDRKEAELRLSWLADHDPLTDLFNRRRFQSELERILAESKRYQRMGALLFVDLDHFKYINDTQGHRAGDVVLKGVAEQLSRLIRSTDFISRIGGDEFALVISETDQIGAIRVAKKVTEYLNDMKIPKLGQPYKVSASIGIALFPKHGETVQEVLTNADLAMYQAKEKKRGNWHLFSGHEQLKERMQKRIYWKDKIREAFDRDGFVIHFQPVNNIATGEVYFHEALLRMRGDNGKLVPPGTFIPVAEASGLILPIDHLVMERVITCQALLEKKGYRNTFSINLSGHALGDRELLPHLKKTLDRTGADPKTLIFEITETAAVSDLVSACSLMYEIKALGCRFALDDFGSGFSSFSYMKQLPVDFVKIGDTFITELASRPEDQIFVKSLSEVTRGMGKKTVAEGVEDAKTLALLREYNVDFAQGYHVGRPAEKIKT